MRTVMVLCLVAFLASVCDAQWVQTSLNSGRVSSFAVSGTNLFAGTDGGVFLSTNNGTNWMAVNSGLPYPYVSALGVSPNGAGGTNLFAGIGDGDCGIGVFRSTNNGTNWTPANSGLTDASVHCFAVSGMNLFAGAVMQEACGVGGVFLSTNNGASWTIVNSGLLNPYVLSLAISGPNLFAGTYGGGIFLSTNNGTSWTAINSDLTASLVHSLAVIPNGTVGTNLFAGTMDSWITGGVYLSTNNGTNWTPLNPSLWYNMVSVLAVSGTNLFVAMGNDEGDHSVFLSTNNGTNWTAVNTGLPPNTNVSSLAVNGEYLFAGTDSSGVWRRPLSEMVSVDENKVSMPDHFSLEQNYPNPFNPSTTITYSLPHTSSVALKVYDVLGREVVTPVNGVEEPGYKSVRFDATNLASGVYFYRLQAGSFVEAKKFILLK